MSTTTYSVDGMTCGHCAQAITTEISQLPGVESVVVDLTADTVSVESKSPLDTNDLRAAIEEAGYALR